MRHAFTTIELLVALALTAVLMIAVLDVTTAASGSLRAMDAAQENDEAWIDRFGEQLTRDLVHAERLVIAGDRIEIVGHGGIDPATLAMSHSDCGVTYRIVRAGVGWWLVREQVEPDRRSNLHAWTELIGEGPRRLRLERIADSPAGRSRPDPPDAITPTVRWTLEWTDEDRPPVRRVVRLR